MRGEDIDFFHYLAGKRGSPPHARGRPKLRLASVWEAWITPACAGKTSECAHSAMLCQDHPRMRGEDGAMQIVGRRQMGSPPHARGRQYATASSSNIYRITPACAGKTGSPPHARGRPGGSPPHARGRPLVIPRLDPLRGITPACAGKTEQHPTTRHTRRDHPRMRGEDPGRPLRTRGRSGITPACAGKTVRFPRESGKVVFQPTSFPSLPT